VHWPQPSRRDVVRFSPHLGPLMELTGGTNRSRVAIRRDLFL
jgi:hypothetical protein